MNSSIPFAPLPMHHLADHLTRDAQGVWVASGQTAISYPESGNDTYHSLEDTSFWFGHRNRVLSDLVRRYPPPGFLADVGGGNGFVARAIEEAGFPTVLVEPGAAGARNACARGLQNVVCATLESAGFKPNSLPAVGLFDVLEHIDDDLGFLKSLNRLMRPAGRLYLTVPAYGFLWSSEDVEAGHYRRYTIELLSRRLKASGFSVEYASYFFAALPMPVFLMRTVPSFLGLRRSVDQATTHREHARKGGLLGWLVDRLFAAELRLLRDGWRLPFGGSCLVVARTNETPVVARAAA